MRTYELTTLNHLFRSHWLLDRAEQERFRDIVLKWKRTNKDADIFHEMLVESLVRLHLMEQRLVNRTQFFSGEKTDYRYIREEKAGDIPTEDAQRKQAEFDKYFFTVLKHKTELLKLAISNGINLNITEEGGIQSLFSALAAQEKSKPTNRTMNGNGSIKETINS